MTEEEILKLLASGKISTSQAEAAIKKLDAKDTTSAVSSASSKSNESSDRENPLDKLVANGTITQEQEDSIRTAFKQAIDTNRAMQAYSVGGSSNNQI